MKKLNNYLGKPRYTIADQPVVELCCNDEKFNRWFNDKFLKWEYEPIDQDALDCLSDSIVKFLND